MLVQFKRETLDYLKQSSCQTAARHQAREGHARTKRESGFRFPEIRVYSYSFVVRKS